MGKYVSVAVMMMFLLAGGAVGAAKYSTPAEVVAAYEKAHDAGDDAAGIDCLSPEGLDKTMKFMVGMELATRQPEAGVTAPAPSAEEKKAAAELDALLAKHGIKDLAERKGEEAEAYINRVTAHVTDERGLVLAMMKRFESGEKPGPCRKGEVKDLKITGDTATAKYAVKDPDGSSMSQDLKFKNIDGSWRLADVVMLSAMDNSDPSATTQPEKSKGKSQN